MRIACRCRSLLLRTMLLATGIAFEASAAAAPPDDDALRAAVDRLAQQALQRPRGTAAGLSVAVARGNTIIVEKGYGLAEVKHNVLANAETMFRIGSVTKQFTAAAIMKLVEQGKLALEDDITKYLPDYPTGGRVITIRHLLNHTSGIRSYTDIPGFMEKQTAAEMTHDELLDYFKDEPFNFEPGVRFSYNNSGYYLLGMIIEKVSGQSYGEFVHAALFEPLGLKRTRYDSNREIIPNRAQGYSIDDDQLVNDPPIGMSIPGAAGGLLSTAGDPLRWQMALTDVGGRVISPESYRQMSASHVLPDGTETGYGFGLAAGELQGHRTIEHGGGIFGFSSALAHYPDDNLHIAVITNSDALDGSRLKTAIARAALGIEEAAAKDLTPNEAERRRFAGTYELEQIKLRLRLFEHEGKLACQAEGQPVIPLLYQGNGEFRASFDESLRIVFVVQGDGPAPSFTLHQGGAMLTAKRVENPD